MIYEVNIEEVNKTKNETSYKKQFRKHYLSKKKKNALAQLKFAFI